MPPVRYTFTTRADREFARLSARDQQRIVTALDRYVEDERMGDVRKLLGRGDEWRLRVGVWRVRFSFSDDGTTLIELRVLPRGRAYRY
jgi:mRNA-degrading endonuclease RelE of RelBE toxin-antitoxin system